MSTVIRTRSGRQIDLLNVTPDDIDFGAMAFALARIVRFTGHVNGYSVAQHSVEVSRRSEFPLYGLVHDGHEYLLGDLSRPVQDL